MLPLDGSDFPKQGTHSVNINATICGALGKRANCQAGVFLGYASPQGDTLLNRRLYLPQEWLTDEAYADRRLGLWGPHSDCLYHQAHAGLGDDPDGVPGRDAALPVGGL